jgi:hypothetical protein
VANEQALRQWLADKTNSHPGLTIKMLDGTAWNLYPPYVFGADFVSGFLVKGKKDDEIAVTYNGIGSVTPHPKTKPKGF